MPIASRSSTPTAAGTPEPLMPTAPSDENKDEIGTCARSTVWDNADAAPGYTGRAGRRHTSVFSPMFDIYYLHTDGIRARIIKIIQGKWVWRIRLNV